MKRGLMPREKVKNPPWYSNFEAGSVESNTLERPGSGGRGKGVLRKGKTSAGEETFYRRHSLHFRKSGISKLTPYTGKKNQGGIVAALSQNEGGEGSSI